MAVADGVAYVRVVDMGTTYKTPAVVVGTSDFLGAKGEMVGLDVATGKLLWAARLPQMPLGGATVAGDPVFTPTFGGGVGALSRADGSIVWTAQLPAASKSTLAVAGDTLIAGAGLPLTATQPPAVVPYRLG